jgi:signal transduction histidine kinase
VDFPDVVRNAVDAVIDRPHDAKSTVRIETVLDPPAVADIRSDPERLQQILWNLLSNAVKFTSKGWHRSKVAPASA